MTAPCRKSRNGSSNPLVKDIDKYWDAVDAEKGGEAGTEGSGAKEVHAGRVSGDAEEESARRLRHLLRRPLRISLQAFMHTIEHGFRARALEVALTNLLENDVVGGKEYAQTDKGKSMVHKLAHNRSLKPGNGSWFYRTKEKRPKQRDTDREH